MEIGTIRKKLIHVCHPLIDFKETSPQIEVYSGSSLLWSAKASQPRVDLTQADLGNAAFSILPDRGALQHDITSVQIFIDGHKLKKSYPLQLQAFKIEDYKCNIDETKGVLVRGWACNNQEGAHRPKVELRSQGNVVAQGVAEMFRQDLLDAKIGDGKYGFNLQPNLAHFSSTTVLAQVYVDGKEMDLAPIELTASQEAIDRARLENEFTEELGTYNEQLNREKKRIAEQIVDATPQGQETNLNIVANIALDNIADLSARLSMLERVMLQYLDERK